MTDASTGEAILFGNVMVVETSTGNSSDLDGNYSLSLDEGVYTLEFSYLGYTTLTITDVKVVAGEDTELHVKITEDTQVLDEIVVTATQIRNTETALLAIQRKATGLLDGISTQAIKRSGDSDVGSAIKRVTGVSVENGKHVIVRGLGDRYSKTILNGMSVPGLDPDRNSVQLDIFPTNLVDNIIVYKSFSPELPGDFTGGMVNIITKDFPETKTFTASASGSYNPDMHFNNNFITYDGGGTDFLGFDDGTRALPLSSNYPIPSITDGNENLSTLTNLFNPTMATMRERSGMNYNLAASYGNQINLSSVDIGFTLAANYKNETEYFDNVVYNTFFKDPVLSQNELLPDVLIQGQLGNQNVQWSTQAGTALKTKNHKLSLSALHSQNGISRAAFFDQTTLEFGQAIVEKHNLEYTERSVTNFLMSGKHSFGSGNLQANWKLSPTFSNMSEPDIRLTAYETTNDRYELNRATGGGITRTWRAMDETNYAGAANLVYKFEGLKGLKSNIKFGFAGVLKDRDFEILDYVFPIRKRGTIEFTGDPNEIFTEENVWTPENDNGAYVEFNFEPAKSYNARQNILAGYLMNELPLSEKFKVIYGARVEKADNWYTGRRQNIVNPDTDLFEDRKVLDDLDILPSLNMVYMLSENKDEGKTMNLRGSASRTVARPSFKEKSIAQIEDRISGRTFIGNIDLEATKINNADLRWEYFLPQGQIFSVSTFYKAFENPIELTAFDATSPNSFIPRNVGDATVYGLEFEVRKNLSFIMPALSPISLSLNTTVVNSEVNMTEEEIAGRTIALRDGETLGTTRDMVGQSPYLINAGINYIDIDRGWEGNLSFNTQGERLSIVGISNVPDVYEKPFDSLSFKISKRLGEDNSWKLSFGMQNILNAERQRVYKAFEAQDELFELFQPGRAFSFGISYTM
jgi:TonB-dependent receptor